MIFRAILILIVFSEFSDSANILVVIPTPSFSHQIAFAELWKELSLRDHKVTLVTTNPRNDPTLPNLKEIDVSDSYTIWNKHNFSLQVQEGINVWKVWDSFVDILTDALEQQLVKPEIQELIHNKRNISFDVVIAEMGYHELIAFGKIYNCPTIIAATIGSIYQLYYHMGNPTNPAIHSDMNLPYVANFTFKERLISTLLNWHLLYSDHFRNFPLMQSILNKFFSEYTNATVAELINNVDLMLVNLNPVLHGVRALAPTTVYVGGANHMKPSKPLPKELKDYLDSAKNGFIYFSLGGNVKSKDLEGQKLNAIIKTFKELPYKILWKFEAEDLPGKPKNVKLVKWTPQQDVLRHPNIKLFICQGGILSIEEAIFSHVPLIVMPFFGDQLKNARIVEAKGIGKAVEHKPILNQEDFKNAILEVAGNKKYKESVKKLAELMQDQPMTGLELAIWWIEYVIRHKGAKHLRNPAADLPFYQYFLLDVISFLLLVVAVTVTIFVVVLKLLISLLKSFLGKSRGTVKVTKTE